MNHAQLPRFQVFLQEKAGQPHQDVGSVHAPDAEMAIYNARDVFVRRPECNSLWVVPAGAIYSQTAQELAMEGEADQANSTAKNWIPGSTGEPEAYYVFSKTKSAGTQTFAGEVQAASPVEALHQGIATFGGKEAAFGWWVFPARMVECSQPGDVESMFLPALDKPFRLSTDFHTQTAMRQIRERKSLLRQEG
jgi:ring-1,2-phenylacetyl-CoA epoxidase subunit PaaB